MPAATISVIQPQETESSAVLAGTEEMTESASADHAPVNINTAGKEELITLPGVGDTLARRILEHRSEVGSFSKVTDLMLVEGIGEKRMEELLDYITIGG